MAHDALKFPPGHAIAHHHACGGGAQAVRRDVNACFLAKTLDVSGDDLAGHGQSEIAFQIDEQGIVSAGLPANEQPVVEIFGAAAGERHPARFSSLSFVNHELATVLVECDVANAQFDEFVGTNGGFDEYGDYGFVTFCRWAIVARQGLVMPGF